MAPADLDWLRRLVDDVPAVQHDLAIGDGSTTAYFFSVGTPAGGVLAVTLNDVPQVLDTHYQMATGSDGIVFDVAPAGEARVRMDYTSSAWGDAELEHFLAQAALDWDRSIGRVYAAAILAIDTTLMGLAAALNFGAGAEQFDMVSVFDRLTRHRATLAAQLDIEARRPGVYAPAE